MILRNNGETLMNKLVETVVSKLYGGNVCGVTFRVTVFLEEEAEVVVVGYGGITEYLSYMRTVS